MNGFTPDRRPQQLAQMLAAQERNQMLTAPAGQRDMGMQQMPGLGYGQATPNAASGMPPQAMNFNGPMTTMQPGLGVNRPQMGMNRPQMGMPQMSPQVGGPPMRPRMPSPAGMTTPQGGGYRGDFDYGQE